MNNINSPHLIYLKQYINDLSEGEILTITKFKNRIYVDIEDSLTLDFCPLYHIEYNKKQTLYTDDWDFLSKIRSNLS